MSTSGGIVLYPDVLSHKVSPYLYSGFGEQAYRCIYGGVWVGEDSEIENEKGIRLDNRR